MAEEKVSEEKDEENGKPINPTLHFGLHSEGEKENWRTQGRSWIKEGKTEKMSSGGGWDTINREKV